MLFPESKGIDLSISIVSYNVRDLLDECLGSIETHTRGINYEVIVVDNASHDGTAEMISRKHPTVRIINNRRNRGFAAAQNMGLSRGRGRYLFSLDSDTYIREDTFTAMVRFMDQHPDAGAAGAKLLSPQGVRQYSRRRFPPSVWPVIYRGSFLKYLLPPSRQVRYYEMSDVVLNEEAEVDWVYGGNIIFRREALTEIGLFDERFFIYCEDIDISYRMQEHGWKRYFVPDAKIYHYGSQGTRQIKLRSYLRHVSSYLKLFHKYGWRLQVDSRCSFSKSEAKAEMIFLLVPDAKSANLDETIGAIEKHSPACSYKILVIEQGTGVGGEEGIKRMRPGILWVCNAVPKPFWAVVNQALGLTESEYLVMAPNRPEAVFGQFDALKGFMDQRPKTGMAGVVCTPDENSKLPPDYINERELFMQTCMMVRRSASVGKTNGWRGGSQLEWCRDYQNAGYSVHYLVNI
jgi:GT2 family glycosyltransferase